MYALKNKVQLIGHLGKDPEIKTIDSGKKVARFTMATNDSYKNQNGDRVDETQWHNLVAWGKTAELAEQYLNKGSEIAVEGKLTHRDYVDNTGAKKFITEVIINEFMMLDKKAK